MQYKRNEPFRFTFTPPVDCTFTIVEIDHIMVNSKNAAGKLIDLSPNGAKIASNLDIPINTKKVKVNMKFKINLDTILAVGILVWKKEHTQLGNSYGVQFENTSVLTDVITEELKLYAKQNR
ncbi:PilZ domain-containing protein [Metabacillus halosaccharovorans]|uniref:PilZ domain-containing protein n=1 Tax=Metabacillus halosaccharovorans TaxID=930124 RepID=UPI00203AE941|nr:PilZ domain-containing protein [Metabacillus halosaccharovorans]MCM3443397.1 PilZ domain-containing protein [Metabacillus halosaccharovorans]